MDNTGISRCLNGTRETAERRFWTPSGRATTGSSRSAFLAEAERTLSQAFHDELAPPRLTRRIVLEALEAGRLVDSLKRTLFYGKAAGPAAALRRRGIRGPSPASTSAASTARFSMRRSGSSARQPKSSKPRSRRMGGAGLDDVNLLEEAGDVEWFLSVFYRRLGLPPEDARDVVVAKLRRRYPGRFDAAARSSATR